MNTHAKQFVDFLKINAKVSTSEDNIYDNPFFMPTGAAEFKHENKDLSCCPVLEKLPLELRIMYSCVGKDKEVTINNFTFLKLSKIEQFKNQYPTFIDVAVKYGGMGHVIVVAVYDLKVFLRIDGGSNGYDRASNKKKYTNYVPTNCMSINEFMETSKTGFDLTTL